MLIKTLRAEMSYTLRKWDLYPSGCMYGDARVRFRSEGSKVPVLYLGKVCVYVCASVFCSFCSTEHTVSCLRLAVTQRSGGIGFVKYMYRPSDRPSVHCYLFLLLYLFFFFSFSISSSPSYSP